ncbi:hypothetical protein SDC9_166465 [bioreactor metagenome]|uniref:Uncharacterized protein n=1 Tax=bioreactor metagenome TaxID=1076179 RepID=A0A645FZP4_9ZZZZ
MLKIQQGHGGNPLKFRGLVRHPVHQRLHLPGKVGQFLVRDVRPVHLHPLVDAKKVGRGVKPGGIARPGQNLREHGAHGALSVGPRHMNELQALLGGSQQLHQRFNTLQSQAAPLPGGGVDKFQRLRKVHTAAFLPKCPSTFVIRPMVTTCTAIITAVEMVRVRNREP